MKQEKNIHFLQSLTTQAILLLLLVIVVSCGSAIKSGPKINSSKTLYSYQKDAPKIAYQLKVFHHTDDRSQLHYAIPLSDVIYSSESENSYKAFVKISYRLLLDNGTFVDSLSFVLTDKSTQETNTGWLKGFVELNTTYNNNYFVEVKIRDLNRSYELASLIAINKSTGLSRENFLLKDKNNQLVFTDYIAATDTLTLFYNQKSNVKNLFVKYYNREFQLPPPPFVLTSNKSFDYKPDSTFSLSLSADNTTPIHFPKEGFYQIEADSTSKIGMTLFRFGNGYPVLINGNKLLPPTRFITTRQEYEEMNLNNNKKASLESFWIKNTGNKDKARHAITTYYKRVEKANQYFSSYTEGWRTERGIVYLIFGEPNNIYKQADSETWVYGEEGNYRSTSFTFIKVINPFTDNDYLLNRSEIFKEEWYRYVDAWRIGKIINE